MKILIKYLIACSTLLPLIHGNASEEESTINHQLDFNEDDTPTHSFIHNLTDVCNIFNISLENCTCSLFTINGTDKNQFPDFCSLEKHVKTVLHYPASLSRAYASVTVVSSIVGIIGNIAVILVAYKNKKNLPACKWLIALLAVSDLFFAVQQLILAIPLFWTNVWLMGEFMCKFLRSGLVLGTLVSISLILAIALERYVGILYPIRKRNSGNFIYFFTAGLVLLSIAASIPLFIVYTVHTTTGHCGEVWPRKRKDGILYDWFIMIIFFVLPVLIIAFLYTRIILHLNSQNEVNHILNDNDKEKRWNENKRVMRILLIILLAFIICVFPNRFAWLYFNITNYQISQTVYIVICYMALLPYPIHVACNPIIYSLVDKTWRKDILLIFGIRKRSRISRSSATSNTTIRTNDSKSSVSTPGTSYGSMFTPTKYQKDGKTRGSVDHTANLLKFDANELQNTEIKTPVGDDVFE